MDDVQLANWCAGADRRHVEVCRLFDSVLLLALGVESGAVVCLSDYTLTKTSFTHAEIDFQDYKLLPRILADGFVIPGNKKRSVVVIYADLGGAPFKFWHACLKGTGDQEVFVTMFHRGNLKEVKRLYRQACRKERLLRDHSRTPVRRLLIAPARSREGGAP